jgi:hypothetical protein
MKNTIWLSIALLVPGAGSLLAHHSYAEYDRNAPVTLEGTVRNVQWANPHITLQFETEEKGVYSIELSAPSVMIRSGIEQSTFVKTGDRLLITGSVNRNPEKKILTIVREIHRPSDGWEWTRAQVAAPR